MARKKRKSLTAMVSNYQRGTQDPQATANWVAGEMGLTESPTIMAADKAQDLLRAVQQMIGSGRWQAACQAVSLNYYKNKVQAKQDRYASGCAAAVPVWGTAIQRLIPVYDQMRAAADAVNGPKGEATSIAKANAALRVLIRAGKKAQGSTQTMTPA